MKEVDEMLKVKSFKKQYKGFIIVKADEDSGYQYWIFTKDEYSMGKGYRYPEWEADELQECIDFIDSY
jgi:hypothetical protein